MRWQYTEYILTADGRLILLQSLVVVGGRVILTGVVIVLSDVLVHRLRV